MLELIKENLPYSLFYIYFISVSIISIVICIYDKKISKKNRVELRVPERTLLLLSAIGGSVAMFICMILVRHKTKHLKFMLGIPLIILAQAVAIYLLFYYNIFPIV